MAVARLLASLVCGVTLLMMGGWVSAQQAPVIPYEPPRQFGTSITGAFEGWLDRKSVV